MQAARELSAEHGYFATTVEQVARRADVSPATVYAVAGGKAGLVESLVQLWAEAPILADSARRLQQLDDPQGILDLVAAASREVPEQYGDIMKFCSPPPPTKPLLRSGYTARRCGTAKPWSRSLNG